mmetsp:Transcript_34031/g.74689  ORF Transcript_34031/g.74689 Transcript_34031/m.74689 type:complete len:162 (+) Transcript_34031:211-696(+)
MSRRGQDSYRQGFLTAQQIREYRDAFNLFDKDRDGYITAEELSTVMKSVGFNPTANDLRELIGDSHGSYSQRGGRIDFNYFCKLMSQKSRDADSESELRDAFRVLDLNGQGFIGLKEMQAVCFHLGQELQESEVFDMVSEAISNFDGKIFYDGFKKILISQ